MSQLDRRQLLKMVGGVAVAGMAGSAAGCTSAPQGTQMERPSGRTIVIGFIAPAVGPYAQIGDEIAKGFNLFLDEHDKLVGTHRAELRLAEEGSTAADAVEAVKSVLAKGAVVVAGVANPLALGPVATALGEAKTPLISPAASPVSFPKNMNFTWRTGYVQGEAGRSMAAFARANGPRAFVMNEETDSARADAAAFTAEFQKQGGTIVTGTAKGVGPRLQAAKNGDANSIFAAYTGNEAQQVLDQFRGMPDTMRLLGPFNLTESVDLAKLSSLPQRVYTSGFYTPDLDNLENRRFVSGFHKAHAVPPTSVAMVGYDMASSLDKALRLIEGDLSGTNINQGFNMLGRIESPRGPWSFNASHSPQQKWYLRHLRLDGQVPANLLDNDLAVLS